MVNIDFIIFENTASPSELEDELKDSYFMTICLRKTNILCSLASLQP